eukprot:5728337-Pleurochrysis_carterae.AAC.1
MNVIPARPAAASVQAQCSRVSGSDVDGELRRQDHRQQACLADRQTFKSVIKLSMDTSPGRFKTPSIPCRWRDVNRDVQFRSTGQVCPNTANDESPDPTARQIRAHALMSER